MNHRYMRFPGGKPKALTLSYDDGVEQDIELMALLEKYQVKCTFNLNSGWYPPEDITYPAGTIHRRMPKSKVDALYQNPLAEVACHSYTHPFLDQLAPSQAMKEIVDDRIALENQFGRLVRGFAYPYGRTNDDLVEILRLAGIVYARTVVSHHSFELPTDWLRLGATCHHDDPMLMELADKFTSETPERESWLFYLWGHSYEFEANDNWNVIDKFLETVSGKDDVWYATNIEVYNYCKAYESLLTSADGNTVYNPTSIPVWVQLEDEIFMIEPGKSVTRNVPNEWVPW